MVLSSDLMGLGESPLLAQRLANGGTGPVSITVTGTGSASATSIYGTQFVVNVSAISGGGAVALPSPSSATAPLIYDDFVLHNGTSGSLTVYPPSGVTVNIGGTAYVQTNPFTLATLKTLTWWTGPTTTQWFGLSA